MKIETDIAVIGAGPVGLFCAFEAGMLGMKAAVIDVLDIAGGQCSVLYPQKPIYDIPAYPQISGQGLVDNLLAQNAPFHPQYLLGEAVEEIAGEAGNFHLRTSSGKLIACKAVIIAAGNGLFGPNRLPIAGCELFENRSLFYFVNDPELFRDKQVAIAGGGDSAVDWAVALAPIARKVYFIHRRDKFRAHPAMVARLDELSKTDKLEYVIPFQIQDVKGQQGLISEVVVSSLEGHSRGLKVDYLLPFFGLRAELGPIHSFQLELEGNLIKVDPASMQTTRLGIYAVGDICSYPGKLKLILTGFAEVARACHSAYNCVFPGRALHFEYSTSKGVGN